MEIKRIDNKIVIIGHFEDNIKCAKLTAICETNNPFVLKKGYCELPFNKKLYKYLLSLNNDLLFVGGSFKFLYWDGTQWVSEVCTDSLYHFDTDVVTAI